MHGAALHNRGHRPNQPEAEKDSRCAEPKPDVWIIDEDELDRRELKFLERVDQYKAQLNTVK